MSEMIFVLTEYNKIQIADVTEIKSPNTGTNLLQKWKIMNNIKNGGIKIEKFFNQQKQPVQQQLLEQDLYLQ